MGKVEYAVASVADEFSRCEQDGDKAHEPVPVVRQTEWIIHEPAERSDVFRIKLWTADSRKTQVKRQPEPVIWCKIVNDFFRL